MKKRSVEWYLQTTEKDSNGCMIPTATAIRVDGEAVSLARLIYERFFSKNLSRRSRIRRTCKNGKCINPDHMLPSSGWDKFFGRILYKNEGNNGCWEWMGSKDGGGYGMGMMYDKKFKAHRACWEYYYGEIPDGMWVLHTCDNPSCVNPTHLFLGTNQDNIDDKVRKERQSRLFGDRNGRSLMTEDKVREMRSLYETGNYSYRTLAKRFGISMTQTARILKMESWSWV